jgi:GAF domain-containing protein
VESYLAIPVYDLEGKPIGHMGVMNDIPMRNRESAESILRIFAIRAGAELNRMLAEETLKARVRQQAAVADLGQRALKGEGLSPLMDEAVRLVSETLDVEFCKILELLPDHRSLLLRAGVGWKKGLVGRATVGSDVRSQAGFTLKSDEPVMVADLGQEIRFTAPPLLMDHGVVSGISVVIPGHAVPFGVLGAHSARRRVFSKEDAHFLRSVANVVAGAIERKRSERAMMELESRWRSVSGQSPEN